MSPRDEGKPRLVGEVEATEAAHKKHLTQTYAAAGLDVPDKVAKAILGAAVPDPDAPVITDRQGPELLTWRVRS